MYLVDGGLAAAGRTDQHDAVSYKHRLIQLNHLQHLFWDQLETPHHNNILNLVLEPPVVVFRDVDPREQVLKYCLYIASTCKPQM